MKHPSPAFSVSIICGSALSQLLSPVKDIVDSFDWDMNDCRGRITLHMKNGTTRVFVSDGEEYPSDIALRICNELAPLESEAPLR